MIHSYETHKGIVGVDVGVRYLAVTSTTKGDEFFLYGKTDCPESQPLCETEKASAKERHSCRHTSLGSDKRTRETVEARRQSLSLAQHRATPSQQSDRPGRPDRYPRANETPQRQKSDREAETLECGLLKMVLCGIASHDCL